MYQDVSQNYRRRNRPALIAGAVCGLALLFAVVASFFLGGVSTVGRSGEQAISPEDMEVTRITSVPGYSKATCWKAATTVEETNIVGSALLTHSFATTWCAQDGKVIYQADSTTVDSVGEHMRSEVPQDTVAFSSAYEVSPREQSEILVRRIVYGTTGWADYGFERCVRFILDAQGNAEGALTCTPSL